MDRAAGRARHVCRRAIRDRRGERQLVEAAQLGFGVGAGMSAVGGGQGDAAVAEGEVEEIAMAARQFDHGPAPRRRCRRHARRTSRRRSERRVPGGRRGCRRHVLTASVAQPAGLCDVAAAQGAPGRRGEQDRGGAGGRRRAGRGGDRPRRVARRGTGSVRRGEGGPPVRRRGRHRVGPPSRTPLEARRRPSRAACSPVLRRRCAAVRQRLSATVDEPLRMATRHLLGASGVGESVAGEGANGLEQMEARRCAGAVDADERSSGQ